MRKIIIILMFFIVSVGMFNTPLNAQELQTKEVQTQEVDTLEADTNFYTEIQNLLEQLTNFILEAITDYEV
ncbi:MAG: hypothetical protein ACK5HR_06460 [Mycoplasmatales bacterium]